MAQCNVPDPQRISASVSADAVQPGDVLSISGTVQRSLEIRCPLAVMFECKALFNVHDHQRFSSCAGADVCVTQLLSVPFEVMRVFKHIFSRIDLHYNMHKRARGAVPAADAPVAQPVQPSVIDPPVELHGSPVKKDDDSSPVSSPQSGAPLQQQNPLCPPSPASNRLRFHASLMPAQICCDLSAVTIDPGHRFTFQGIILVVFPASANPLRRHVLVGDGRGVVGITVWNAHVNSFSSQSIGQLLVVSKVSVVVHNGTRGITLNKESSVTFNSLADHFASVWWKSIPQQPVVSAIIFADAKDNTIVNVAGILGSVSVEQKTVRSDARDLVTIKLVDRTGIVTLRTWNHNSDAFLPLVDSPVMFRRVRVTSFASIKSGELFDGIGTIIDTGNFFGAEDLQKFWDE